MGKYISCILFCLAGTIFYTFTASNTNDCPLLREMIPVKKNFTMDRFVGQWFTVLRSKWMLPEGSYGSSTLYINSTGQPGVFSAKQRLFRTDSDQCSRVFESQMLEVQPGVYKMGKVYEFEVETDYHNMSLSYYCFEMFNETANECRPDRIHIIIRSRTSQPNAGQVAEYKQLAMEKLCGIDDDFIETTLGLCPIVDED